VPSQKLPRFEHGERTIDAFGARAVTAGIVEARQKF
jgi:hypothetical protein